MKENPSADILKELIEIILFKDEGIVNIEEIEKEIVKYNDSKKEK